MNWKEKNLNLGGIKAGSSIVMEYESTKPLQIDRVLVGCTSCTKFLGYKNNIMQVKFLAGDYPIHLKGTKHKPVVQGNLSVYLHTGEVDNLSFTGFLTEK